MLSQKPLAILVGPTASGKTDLAIRAAASLRTSGEAQKNVSIISADSRQVYAGMNIGTGKPDDAWQMQAHEAAVPDKVSDVPHYLFNIREAWQPLTLADWQEMAFTVIDRLLEYDELPLLTGGTMLYADSVARGFHIPAVAPDRQLRAQLESEDTGVLYARLVHRDPEAKKFIEPHNTRRIIRALEVIEGTGKLFSELRRAQQPPYAIRIFGLFPSQGWEELRERIAKRAQQMFALGLLEEVEWLRKAYDPSLPLLRTQNYRQAGAVLDGAMTQKAAIEDMVQSDMRYAHRQMSWWKKRREVQWIQPGDIASIQEFFSGAGR